MKKKYLNPRNILAMLSMALIFTITSCDDTIGSDENAITNPNTPAEGPSVNITALSDNNSLVYYNAKDANSVIRVLGINGLPASEKIISIDYRPATGQLYALGSSSRLYFINEESGLATALGAASFTPAIDGANASINFNPTVDRIRLVTESGQNLRLHPELGTVAATDGAINGGDNPRIGAVAYTNSVSGAASTMLYDIDFESDKLYLQTPPNDGGLQEVGPLTVDFSGTGSFDISPDNSSALAVTNTDADSKLYTIDLTTGKAVWVGTFSQAIIGLSVKSNPVAFATTADNKLQRFNPLNPVSNPIDLLGLNASETVVGLDFRPATGTLYAITNQSRLLTVNTATGQLTAVGSVLAPALSGDSFGFDFNPTVDRIRLVSNTGQNLRIHPDLGTVAFTDGNLNPGSPVISGAAYTNNFITSTTTTLFVVDTQTNMLYRQIPPNDGVLVPVGALGIDIESQTGFDIGGSSNMAFGLFKVNGNTAVYQVNLSNGTTTKVKDFNVNATAMAVGLGF